MSSDKQNYDTMSDYKGNYASSSAIMVAGESRHEVRLGAGRCQESRSVHVDQDTFSRVRNDKMAFSALGAAKKHLRRLKAKERWKHIRSSITDHNFLNKMQNIKDLEALDEDEDFEMPSKPEGHENWEENLKEMIFGKPLNLLLLFMPVSLWAEYSAAGSDQMVFWFTFLTMIPLASLLSDFTEELAMSTNEIIGGLLNATFGNAVEVVVGIQALLRDEIRIVQASMMGSIFSNLLLVLGCCFFFGGTVYKEQHYNGINATANLSLLSLTSIALVLPLPFATDSTDFENADALSISRVSSVFLIIMYASLLVFQLKTHADLLVEEESETPNIPLSVALAGLVICTALVTFLSDYLVASIDGFVDSTGISKTFVGMIILPIVGNAVEHITAVTVAMKDKMDMAISVAVGSCVQISLFALPFTVLAGWIVDKPMNVNFPFMETVLFVLSMIVVSICMKNDTSNWLYGFLLINTYCMIGVFFWHENPETEL